MRLRFIWNVISYITARELPVLTALKAAVVDWKKVEQGGGQTLMGKAKDKWMKAKARRKKAKEKAEAAEKGPSILVDIS